METYVEVSALFNFISILISMLLASYANVQPMKLKNVLYYALCISLLGCLSFYPYAVWVMLCIELLFFIAYFKRKRKTYLFALAIRWLMYVSVFAWYGGGFHNGLYFIPLHVNMWLIWILYIGSLLLLKRKWKDLLTRANYVYEVTLYFQHDKVVLKGYLDSGNLLMHEHVPVIFLNEKYQVYFQDERIELIVMNTVQHTETKECHPCQIQLEGCKKHAVFVSCTKLQLPYECDVLLNMNLMTLG